MNGLLDAGLTEQQHLGDDGRVSEGGDEGCRQVVSGRVEVTPSLDEQPGDRNAVTEHSCEHRRHAPVIT